MLQRIYSWIKTNLKSEVQLSKKRKEKLSESYKLNVF